MSGGNEENTKNSKHEERATKCGTIRAQSVSPAAVKRAPERGGGVEPFFAWRINIHQAKDKVVYFLLAKNE